VDPFGKFSVQTVSEQRCSSDSRWLGRDRRRWSLCTERRCEQCNHKQASFYSIDDSSQ
jgi:hypothetical protein